MTSPASTTPAPKSFFRARVAPFLAFAGLAAAVFAGGFALQYFVIADDEEESGGAAATVPTEPGTYRLDTAAVLAHYVGEVTMLQPPNLKLPTALGQVAEEGTMVRVAPNAKATFLCDTGAIVMTASGAQSIEDPVAASPALADVWKDIVPFHRTLPERFDRMLASGQLAKVPNGLEFDTPFGTVFDARPLFSWRDKDDAYPYQVAVRRPGGADVVWQRSLGAPSSGAMRLIYPEEEEPLPRGETLDVEVTSADGRTARGEFRLADDAETASVRNAITATANRLPEIAVANFFQSHAYRMRGCPQAAGAQLLSLVRLFPTERYPLEGQALIRFEAGHRIEARSLVRKLESMPMPIPLAVTPQEPTKGAASPASAAPGGSGNGGGAAGTPPGAAGSNAPSR